MSNVIMREDAGGTSEGILRKVLTEKHTVAAAGTSTTTIQVPAGAVVASCTCYVSTAVTNAASFDIGDGTDVDRFGATIAVAAATGTTRASWTAPVGDTPIGSYSRAAAHNIVFTANGGNFTGGVIHVVVIYELPDALDHNLA